MWGVGWSEVVSGMGKTYGLRSPDSSCVKAAVADGALRHVAFSFF